MIPVKTIILDLDGTLFEDEDAIPGAPEALRRLRASGLSIRFASNTTRMPCTHLSAKLERMGFEVSEGEIVTAPRAAARALGARGFGSVLAMLPRATWVDLEGLRILPFDQDGPARLDPPGAVLVGDLGADWSNDRLNRALQALLEGAELFACHRNRYWRTRGELMIDAGAYVAALEYAAGARAHVIGKPSPEFFWAALGDRNPASRASVLVVGDDVQSDVAGASRAGFQSVLVRTGKYREMDLTTAEAQPSHVLPSVADLPELLGLGSR